MNSRLTLAGICLLAAFGLAACGGGGGSTGGGTGGGTASTPPTMMPGGEMAGPTALETAVELDGRLDDVDVDASRMSAIENAGKLSSESVKGESATAMANAQAVVDANAEIHQAIVDADAVIEEANAAKMAAEDIEDATEKAAVIRLLDNAIAEAEAIKTDAQAHIDETVAIDDPDVIESLGEALTAVRGADDEMPEGPADRAKDVAEAVRTAITAAAPGTNATVGEAPMGAIMHDAADIGAMTWEQAVTARGGTVTDVRRFADSAISEVRAAPIGGFKVSDFLAQNETAPTAGDQTDGTSFDSTRRGIDGTVFCGGTDCKVGDDGIMTGSWYFTPDSTTELFVANPAMAGSYMIATMYARYGYWLTYTDGEASGVDLYAAKGHDTTNEADLDLGQAGDPAADVTAHYSGSAVGISVRGDASGEFTADVNLTAKFAAQATLRGSVSNFKGNAVGNWTAVLNEANLGQTTATLTGGTTAGGGTPGTWTAQGYGPAQTPEDTTTTPVTPAVNHRPEGFYGRFDANFGDGGSAAGAYVTRAD